jgi:hypothetical protein
MLLLLLLVVVVVATAAVFRCNKSLSSTTPSPLILRLLVLARRKARLVFAVAEEVTARIICSQEKINYTKYRCYIKKREVPEEPHLPIILTL